MSEEFSKGDVIDSIKKFGTKEIVIAIKTFKDREYLDIRLHDGGRSTGAGVTLSYRDDYSEVKQLFLAIGTFLDQKSVPLPVFHSLIDNGEF
jgi:hypothetical protein